jgi:PBP1b-binding outer membrane lipoprotein LpoB
MKRISQILSTIIIVLMLVSCKNTKQKLQEYVTTYNATAATFKAENVSLTTARGYIDDNKIELRFETALEQNASNKTAAEASFPKLLKEMIGKNQIPKELIEEGIQFDTYFLANDNTVFSKIVLNKESISEILK